MIVGTGLDVVEVVRTAAGVERFGGQLGRIEKLLPAESGQQWKLPGKPIGAYDLLIAAQALYRKLTLVTANAKEFGRIKSLHPTSPRQT